MVLDAITLPLAQGDFGAGDLRLWLSVSVPFVALIVFLFFLAAAAIYGRIWLQAFLFRADVCLLDLMRMSFRRVKPSVIVNAKIMAVQAGLDIDRRTGISTARLETHYLAGGNVENVVCALIAARRANIDLDFDRAAAIDLAGRDVLDAVGICDARDFKSVCYAARKGSDGTDVGLALRFYYDVRGDDDLRALYREQAIKALAEQPERSRRLGGQEATFEYLLGELYRQHGDFDPARKQFNKAKVLVSEIPRHPEFGSGYEWIKDYAIEQSCRIESQEKTSFELRQLLQRPENRYDVPPRVIASIAVEVLAERQENEARKALAEFFVQGPVTVDRLDLLREVPVETLHANSRIWWWLKGQYAKVPKDAEEEGTNEDSLSPTDKYPLWKVIKDRLSPLLAEDNCEFRGSEFHCGNLRAALPRMLKKGTFESHTVREGDSLEAIARSHRISVARLLEINPALQGRQKSSTNSAIRVIRTPPDWPEERLVRCLASLIEEGNREAALFFIDWCKTLATHSLDEYELPICSCLVALRKSPELWVVPPKHEMRSNRGQEYVHTCLDYVHGNDNRRDDLVGWLRTPWRDRWAELSRRDEKDKAKESKDEFSCPGMELECLAARQDPCAKDIALARLRKHPVWLFLSPECDYLAAVSAKSDVAILRLIAMEKRKEGKSNRRRDLYECEAIEEIARDIQFREMIKRSLARK